MLSDRLLTPHPLTFRPDVLRGMMVYVIDLIIVMRNLFLLMQAREQVSENASSVTHRLFEIALRAYRHDAQHSPQKVHGEISSFVTLARAFLRHKDVIKEVERLIQVHQFKPFEVLVAETRGFRPVKPCN